jgi:hypothetical protein
MWPFAIVAALIAAAWAIAVVCADPMVGPQPDGQPGAVQRVFAFMIAYTLTIAVLSAAAIWLVFHLYVFRKRGSLGKSLGVLALMVVGAFLLALPARLFTLAARVNERTAEIGEWNRAAADRVHAITTDLNQHLSDLGDLSIAGLRAQNEVDGLLDRTRQDVAYRRAYLAQLDREFQAAREAASPLRLTEAERSALLEEFEHSAFAPLRARTALELSAAEKRLEMVAMLEDNKAGWRVDGGRLLFSDAALLQRLNVMGADYDRLVARINAMNQPAPDAGAPPSPQ